MNLFLCSDLEAFRLALHNIFSSEVKITQKYLGGGSHQQK